MLEVEASAARLELYEENVLLPLCEWDVSAFNDVLFGLLGEPSVVLLYHFHAGLCIEHGLEHIHLHAKVAKDNPLVLSGRVADNVPECVELCTAAFPVWPGIEMFEGVFPCGDVDLRVQGELA